MRWPVVLAAAVGALAVFGCASEVDVDPGCETRAPEDCADRDGRCIDCGGLGCVERCTVEDGERSCTGDRTCVTRELTCGIEQVIAPYDICE